MGGSGVPTRVLAFVRKAVSYGRRLAVTWTFEIVERVWPVRDDFWCFATWSRYPHTLDNPRAVFEEIKDDPSVRKIVLQKEPSEVEPMEGRNVVFVPADSIAGAVYLARSRIIITGYALFGLASYARRIRRGRHLIIQLWHGVPLKRIGRLFPGEDFWSRETPLYAAAVCSSARDREWMAGAFAPLPRERVWQTGLPRNDLIVGRERALPSDYRAHLRQLDAALAGRRLVLYAPTWREEESSLYTFSDEEEERLEALLAAYDSVLGIRGHPNVYTHESYARDRGAGAIISVNDYPDPNVILRRADVLITDYSSIYIDFLLLDRPVIHFAYDLDRYREERGFLYDPEEAFAGPCVRTFDELLEVLEAALADSGCDAGDRDRAAALFHEHGQSATAEVCARIRQLLESRTGREDGSP